jgi:predicted transcriptional regulator
MDESKVLRIELLSEEQPRGASPSVSAEPPGGDGTLVRRTARPERLLRLLSDRNVELLRLIKSKEPQSLAELARLSGRPKASLTRTLARLADLGIVVLAKAKGRGKAPTVACDRVRLDVPLTPET